MWREGARCRGKAGWPEAEFVIGNPPFLGSKVFRQNGLPDPYVESMYGTFDITNTSDLCCYWFALTAQQLRANPTLRFGLLATQGIRGRENRQVIERLSNAGYLFDAWADREWVLNGAAVRVSMICGTGRTDATEEAAFLNGVQVGRISPSLTGGVDLGTAQRLGQNRDLCWMGVTKGGSFDVDADTARGLLSTPTAQGQSPFNVVRPWWNGLDITRRPRSMWLIDFGEDRPMAEAAAYDAAFGRVEALVKPERADNRRPSYRDRWWIHAEPRGGLREDLEQLGRYIATPRVTKHRLFKIIDGATIPDCQVFAFVRSDDYFFGVLHSSVHELWALRQGTQLEDRPRYTPTTCFETFPLPWAPGSEPEGARQGEGGEEEALSPTLSRRGRERGQDGHALWAAISAAARELDAQRERWLNPPEWVAEIAAGVDAADDFADVAAVSGEEARQLIRQSAIDAAAARDPRLKKRTLTNLYNERPTWLKLAHERLDRAVLAAYAAVDPEGGWDPDWARVWVETGAGGERQQSGKAAKQQIEAGAEGERGEVEERVLGALLRLNGERAGG